MAIQNQGVYANFAAAGSAPVNAVETVVATTRAVSSPATGSSFLIEALLLLQAGAGTTSNTIRIRRDSLAGTIVAAFASLLPAAGATGLLSASAVDALVGDVAGQLWVVTIQQAGGTGNGTVTNVTTKVTTGV